MRISYMRELLVLARYMNISKAALELNMTQSSLSKHITQIEAEVGASLISHGKKLEFTPAGLYFLDTIGSVVDAWDDLAGECRRIEESQTGPLLIRQPTFEDASAMALYRLLDQFRGAYPNIPVQLSTIRHTSPAAMISAASVDVHLIYERGDVSEVVEGYAERGLLAHPLCADSLGAWLPKSHPLACKEALAVTDLEGVPILESNQIFAPLTGVIRDVCGAQGFEPIFEYRTVQSFFEMITCSTQQAIRLFPYSLKAMMQAFMNDSMAFVPVASTTMHGMLLMDGSGRKKSAEIFAATLASSSALPA